MVYGCFSSPYLLTCCVIVDKGMQLCACVNLHACESLYVLACVWATLPVCELVCDMFVSHMGFREIRVTSFRKREPFTLRHWRNSTRSPTLHRPFTVTLNWNTPSHSFSVFTDLIYVFTEFSVFPEHTLCMVHKSLRSYFTMTDGVLQGWLWKILESGFCEKFLPDLHSWLSYKTLSIFCTVLSVLLGQNVQYV